MTAAAWNGPALRLPSSATHPSVVTASTRVRGPRWPWYAALGAFTQYVAVGAWLLYVKGYAIGDALARTTSAQILIRSRDPHLGAMGFYWLPLPMFIRVPFVVLLSPFDQTIMAGPISTALCAALVIPVLAAIGRELQVRTEITAVFIALYALNPVTIFSAANAMSEAMFALFASLSLLGYVRFVKRREVSGLVLIGLSLGGSMGCRLETIPMAIAAAAGCALLCERERRLATVSLVLLPSAAMFGLFLFASSLIQGDAFYWYKAAKVSAATPANHPWMPADLTPVSIVVYVLSMLVMLSPGLVVVVAAGLTTRRDILGWLGLMGMVLGVPAFLAVQLQLRTNYGTPRFFALTPLFGCVASMWAIGAARHRARPVRLALPVLLAAASLVGAMMATVAYSDPQRTSVERESMFFASVSGRELPDYTSSIERLRPMVSFLDTEFARGKTAVMDSRGGTSVLLSAHPDHFIVPEDRDFDEILADPSGRFDFAVIVSEVDGLSPYNAVIEQAMAAAQGGTFELVEDYGAAKLFEFVPTGSTRSTGSGENTAEPVTTDFATNVTGPSTTVP